MKIKMKKYKDNLKEIDEKIVVEDIFENEEKKIMMMEVMRIFIWKIQRILRKI